MAEQTNRKDPQKESEADNKKQVIVDVSGSIEVNNRIAILPQRISKRFQGKKPQEKLVYTFPNLIIREVIGFQLILIVVVLISLFFNAPLEELANPGNTPNPAKAPWYFLGIQELLHSFPPLIAGIVIPALVIIALLAIPYLNVNIREDTLWQNNRTKTMIYLSAIVFAVAGISFFYHALSILMPTVFLYIPAILPYFFHREKGWLGWLGRRSIAQWIMTWFVLVTIVLTMIGTYFRGPEWKWVWPW